MYNKRKVIFFLPGSVGGAERMTINIAKMLPQEEYEVMFVIIQKNKGTIADFIPDDYKILYIPINSIYNAATLRMIWLIKKEKPFAVFSSLLYINARLIVAAKVCGAKVVVRNNIDISRTTSKQGPILVKTTYRWADKIIAQQDEMKKEIIDFAKVNPAKVTTLHNPIDTNIISNKIKEENPYKESNQIIYIWVARFSPQKGQDLLVRAFRSVKKNIPNAHLYLVGKYNCNNQYDASVIQYVKDHGLTECVHFIGYDKNPYKWIYHADCFVLPSRTEGLPNSLIEAMYLGKPVVATRCVNVIDRIVDEGYNGYVVPSENAEEIAKAMTKAINLRDFTMTYKSATKEDYIKLFEELNNYE